jgi:hypothetical protein
MGDVIAWRARHNSAHRSEERHAESGRILLFTGIRYERLVEPEAPNDTPGDGDKAGKPRRRKRRA